MARLKGEHGSVMDYVRDRRLEWTDLEARGGAFEDPGMLLDFFFGVFFLLFLLIAGYVLGFSFFVFYY